MSCNHPLTLALVADSEDEESSDEEESDEDNGPRIVLPPNLVASGRMERGIYDLVPGIQPHEHGTLKNHFIGQALEKMGIEYEDVDPKNEEVYVAMWNEARELLEARRWNGRRFLTPGKLNVPSQGRSSCAGSTHSMMKMMKMNRTRRSWCPRRQKKYHKVCCLCCIAWL